MKNKITIVAVVIASVILFMVSCKKDNITRENTNMMNDNSYASVVQRIESFRQQMEGNYKNGTLMPLDTAVWSLEALLTNYGGYPDSVAEDYLLMHSCFTLTVDANNMVTNDDVQALYQQMVDTITAQMNGMAGNVKFLRFSDVQQDSVVGNTAYLSSNNSYGTGFILGIYTTFDDDWLWGTNSAPQPGPFAGNCDQTDFSSDASNEIEYRLNHPVCIPIGQVMGYTDIVTNVTDGSHCQNNDGYRIYWDEYGILNNCLSVSQLTFYLTEADDIIKTEDDPTTYNVEGLKAPDKEFMSISITDEVIVANSPVYFHLYHATYGVPYYPTE